MALRAGRVGVNPAAVDVDGFIKGIAADSYTKTEINTMLAGKQDTLTFDASPKSNSNNPVKSKGIYSALAGKQNTLTFDATPTDASDNPVTSNGVYDVVKDVYKDNGVLGAKNLISYPYLNASATNRGITYTVNSDGTIAFSGTGNSSATSVMGICDGVFLPKGSYILSGGSDSYGGVAIYFYDNKACTTNYSGGFSGDVQGSSGSQIYVYTTEDSGGGWSTSNLYGYEKTITFNSDCYMRIQARGVTNAYASSVSGTIYPMIRLASDIDDTYRPYAMTNKELTDNKQDKLVSGTNIKTVNGNSLLGSGNISISGTGGLTVDTLWTNPDTTVAFSPSTITLSADATTYEFIVFSFIGDSITNNVKTVMLVPVVTGAGLMDMTAQVSDDIVFCSRPFQLATSTTISVGSAVATGIGGGPPTANYMIPVAVYGIK